MPPYQFLNLNKLPEAAFEALLWSEDRGSIVFLFLPKEGINRMQERLQFAQDEEISREWLGSESKKKPNNFPPKWHKFVEQELLVLITGFLNRVALTRCIVSETGHQMILFNIAPSYQVNSLGIRLLVRQSVSGIVGGQKFSRRRSHVYIQSAGEENLSIFHPFSSSPRRLLLRRRHYSFCTTYKRENSLFTLKSSTTQQLHEIAPSQIVLHAWFVNLK